MKVEVLGSFDGLDAGRWNGLVERSALPSVFVTWQWQTSWVRAFAAAQPLHLHTVVDDAGVLTGLLPLYEQDGGRLALVGGEDVSDYLDLIAVAGIETAVWDALLDHRGTQPSPWQLRGIRDASPTRAALPALATARGLRVEEEREGRCPVLELPSTWDEYLGRLSGKDRHELRRKMRKLEAELPGATVRSHAAADGWESAMDEFLPLHRASRTGKARFMDERMEGFFRAALARLAAEGWARLWFLDWQGTAIATFLCLEHAGSVGLYNSGFAPDQAKRAPGIVLLGHVIRDAIGRGFPVFDFLRGEEPYKYAFGPTPRDLFRLRVEPAP
jgi:CelD/BcsL family acetyltransferase involved in cellulose biosynthesis